MQFPVQSPQHPRKLYSARQPEMQGRAGLQYFCFVDNADEEKKMFSNHYKQNFNLLINNTRTRQKGDFIFGFHTCSLLINGILIGHFRRAGSQASNLVTYPAWDEFLSKSQQTEQWGKKSRLSVIPHPSQWKFYCLELTVCKHHIQDTTSFFKKSQS